MTAARYQEFHNQHRDVITWMESLPARSPGPGALYAALAAVWALDAGLARRLADELFERSPGTPGARLAAWLDAALSGGKRRQPEVVADAVL
jgi:hypothetical protein